MDIYSTAPGTVVALTTQPGAPLALSLDGWQGAQQFQAIITGFQIQGRGGVQFLHSLRDLIYIYTYGERIGDCSITGIAFAGQCQDFGQQLQPNGLESVYGYYLQNRATFRPTPIQIVIGAYVAFQSFLTDYALMLQDTERVLSQFSLTFKVIPQQNNIG